MVCIYCGHETEVGNSRAKSRLPSVWRRRACKSCVAQFTTLETADYSTALGVRASNVEILPFNRDKLLLSLYKSLGHRSSVLTDATALTDTVIGQLLTHKHAKQGVLELNIIAKTVYEVLKRFDPAAAASYKAYHKTQLTANS